MISFRSDQRLDIARRCVASGRRATSRFEKHGPKTDTGDVRSDADVPPIEPAPEMGKPITVAPGEVCPTCGKRLGLAGAERVRRHRQRRKSQ